ncbi:FISUMP domain-containing protein [Sphingobacterium oryzagri]|uniref:FISUMP domain-containing protein n=1 Tax=Sphingobacterium oryzagri TaxID=3025669 RepID=A0ABY7WI24_9SPHI|nr:FISUMP domain-containing protein [Sphingobacterium sp. KACC 22765]WDF67049.1 FISUMP domain-containing protein [Sphingobacterium sp. KACC 22765]
MKKDNTDEVSGGDGTTITFNVEGIQFEERVFVSSSRIMDVPSLANNLPRIVAQAPAKTGSDMAEASITVLEQDGPPNIGTDRSLPTKKNISSKQGSNKQRPMLAANSVMPTGARYRVVLYANGVHVTTIDAIAGTPFSFTGANRNREYTWFAYSFNNAEQIPNLTNNNNPSLTVAGASGFLYASGTLRTADAANTDNKLNLEFQRKTANIELILDARGMFGNILEIAGETVNAGALKSGTFNLKTGTYGSNFAGNNAVVPFNTSNFQNYEIGRGAMLKTTNFYTAAGGQPIQGWSIKLNTLRIEGDRRVSPAAIPNAAPWGDPHIFNNLTLAIPEFTPQIGKKYRVILTLIMTPMTVQNVQWARGNLYFAGPNDFRFRVHVASHVYGTVSTNTPYTTSYAAGEFFNWKALIPTSLNSVVGTTSSQDPCALVYPTGRWKMPTANDARTLINAAGRSFEIAGSTGAVVNSPENSTLNRAVRRVQFALDGSDLPYDSQRRLSFLLFGYRSVLNDNYTISEFSNSSGNGYYWTSEQAASTTANVLRFFEASATPIRIQAIAKTFGANIRCIRDAQWSEAQIPPLPDAN